MTTNNTAILTDLVTDIGALQRQVATHGKLLDDEVAIMKRSYAKVVQPIENDLAEKFEALYALATTSRAALTADGAKSKDLHTGVIGWRKSPEKVNARNIEGILAQLKARDLGRFIRSEETLNKPAILGDKNAIADIKGLTVTTGEAFFCKPDETRFDGAKELTRAVKTTKRGGAKKGAKS